MLRRLGFAVVAAVLVLPAFAAGRPGSISGYVRSTSGVPQMGAMVDVLGTSFQSVRLFTDENGHFSTAGLLPGLYTIRVSAPSFLPSLREGISLRAGSRVVVNLTLSTLFDALDISPGRAGTDDDGWKWVLRSATNRPILRIVNNGSTGKVTQAKAFDGPLTGSIAFVAGSASAGYGSSSDVSTAFKLEKSLFSTGTMGLSGNLGYSSSDPMVLRLSYAHQLANGNEPQVAFTMRRLAAPEGSLRNADLEALSLMTSDQMALGNALELRFGSELQTIQFMGRVSALQPFGSADLHLSPHTVVEYAYATSEPTNRDEKGFDSAPADLSESGPRLSIAQFSPALEHAHHQEISISQRAGRTSVQLAAYFDRITDPALTGVGSISAETGNILPDVYSGTFTYRGADLDTNGMRIIVARTISPALTATLDYAYGGALVLDDPQAQLDDIRDEMAVRKRQSVAGKFSGNLPKSKTRWIASYRWTDGDALTPVDLFNASPGQCDPYLSIFIRQPIPGVGFLPAHVDAMLDIRNLLAEGYVPVLGQDGRTVYLVQSARVVRGGLAFTF
jgi:Carboxypeptidase regulatory-like domain